MTSESPSRARWLPWLGGLALLAVLFAVLFPSTCTKRVLVEQCTACFAARRTAERGLWLFDRRVLSGDTTVAEDPGSGMDLGPILGPGHVHRWRFGGIGYSCLGLGNGVACGNPGFNPLATAMGNDRGLRARIEARIAAAEYRREEVLAILDLPPVPPPEDAADPARLLLYRRGQDLLRATGAGEASGWPGAAEKGPPATCPGPGR